MDPEWVQVRVRRETADSLRAFARKTFKAVTLEEAGVEPTRGDSLSLDAAIKLLLYREERETSRKQKYQRRPERTHPIDDLESGG